MSISPIDQLLHDAEHKDSGATMANMMRDHGARVRFLSERDNLIAEAHALDPRHANPSWQETSLPKNFLPEPEPDAVGEREPPTQQEKP